METKYEYAGFWIRFLASVIDSILYALILAPVIRVFYKPEVKEIVIPSAEQLNLSFFIDNFLKFDSLPDFIFSFVVPVLITIIFWVYKSATPGKLITKLEIVDAKTAEKPTTSQFIIRYFGYYLSTIPLFLGFLWIVFDPKKQAWHDKISKTVVVQKKITKEENIEF